MRWCLAAVLAAQGCTERRTTPPAPAPAPVVAQAPEPADAGPRVTPATVDAWLRWQRAIAGLAGRRAEAALLREAGIDGQTVDELEGVVAAVVAERAVERVSGAEALTGFRAAIEHLGPERRAEALAALSELEASATPSSTAALEARFGPAAVQAVLAREDEVTKAWERLAEPGGD